MTERFNTYIDSIDASFWRELCLREGSVRRLDKGDEFVSIGTVGRWLGYIEEGLMKYVAYSTDGTPYVVGLEFAGEFVCDFPFSLYRQKARISIVAESPCVLHCIPVSRISDMMESDPQLREHIMHSTEALFSTLYDRYIALYTMTPQQRYNQLISRYPDLFSMFALKDIASYLNITPTHLSRLRRNI